MYLPGSVKENIGEIVLAIDTSGSTMRMQKEFANEFGGILLEARPEKVTIIQCDAAIQSVVEVTPEEFEIAYQPKGFGGTRFSPVFKYIEEHGIAPLALIYLTDLECGETIEDPGFPVLWCSPSYCNYPAKVFGSHIKIDLQGAA
jgi:predicted metal-dependent peptidase